MASTLELLDAIDAQVEENVCIVDAINRTISVPESLRLLGVESDEKAEIRRFRCPKIVGNNIDLTALILFINFENAGGQKGAYRIKDVQEEGDGTNITFSWELERKVTAFQGTPKFSLCAQRVKSGDDGTLEQEWNTTFNEECEVLEGLEVQESIEEEETAALTQIWQKIDELELAISQGGSSGGIKEETDPTVPSWAKNPTKPTYTASEVGADASGTAETKVTEHNVDDEAHNDIRLLVQGLTQKLNALADSDDDTLDQLSEIVTYIKNNKSLIDGITMSKVNVSDIINNLTTNVSNKPLSAAQGVALKALIDGITIPKTLPNPQKLKFTGAVTAEYDGSTEQTVNIPESTGGDSYTLPIMSNTQLGGGKAISKTDEDVPVAVDPKTGQLFVPTYPPGGGAEKEWDYEYVIEVSEDVLVIKHELPYAMKEVEVEGIEPAFGNNATNNNIVYINPNKNVGYRRNIGVISKYGKTYIYGFLRRIENAYVYKNEKGAATVTSIELINSLSLTLDKNEDGDLFREGFVLHVRGKKYENI